MGMSMKLQWEEGECRILKYQFSLNIAAAHLRNVVIINREMQSLLGSMMQEEDDGARILVLTAVKLTSFFIHIRFNSRQSKTHLILEITPPSGDEKWCI